MRWDYTLEEALAAMGPPHNTRTIGESIERVVQRSLSLDLSPLGAQLEDVIDNSLDESALAAAAQDGALYA